ncbi:hypothetical protein WA026_020923 [Henosepilachna vigintioctopunctata]|uniref:Uncharacterized protein n=1 Tax=Henosepilachna vigintioctopunctata TaxID=420089 RepID=A0AAW1UFF3_9CUCU
MNLIYPFKKMPTEYKRKQKNTNDSPLNFQDQQLRRNSCLQEEKLKEYEKVDLKKHQRIGEVEVSDSASAKDFWIQCLMVKGCCIKTASAPKTIAICAENNYCMRKKEFVCPSLLLRLVQ